jgi:filamentous hemagglutinin
VDYQAYLEPKESRNWFEKLTDPVLAMTTALIAPKPENMFKAIQAQPGQDKIDQEVLNNPTLYALGKAVVTAVVTFFTVGWGGAGAAATYDAYYTYTATGDMDQAYKVGARSFATAAVAAGVTAGLGASGAGLYTGSVIGAAGASQVISSIAVSTAASTLAQSLVNGGNLRDNFEHALGASLLNAGMAYGANQIGDAGLGRVGTELAHAALGCAGGAIRSDSSAGCGAGAIGAVGAHWAAQGYDPLAGRELTQQQREFYASMGGAFGGALAAGLGSSKDAAENFGIGQLTGHNAVLNNYLSHTQIKEKERALLAAKTQQERDEINSKYDQLDKQQSQEAFNCVVKQQCASVLEPGSIRAVLDTLTASCAPPRQCSPDAVAGIKELNAYYGQAQAIQPIYPVEEVVLGGAFGAKLTTAALDAVASAWTAARARIVGEIGGNGGTVEASVTSGGTANAATVPGLKGQLAAENLANIAAQDARLAKAVSGDGGKLNFSVGSGTVADANQLGKTWVGDGAQLVADQVGCPGCWKSADGLRIYRPPTPKNAPSSFNPTGVQANFVTLSVNPATGSSTIVGNGHLVVLP